MKRVSCNCASRLTVNALWQIDSRGGMKKSSSCSTIYLDDSTVSQPNLKNTVKCVSLAIYYHIKNRTSARHIDIFDEKLHPLTVSLCYTTLPFTSVHLQSEKEALYGLVCCRAIFYIMSSVALAQYKKQARLPFFVVEEKASWGVVFLTTLSVRRYLLSCNTM